MGQLQAINAELVELGYQIIAVSPDRPERVRDFLKKTSLGFRLLSDTKLSAPLAMGVAYRVDSKTLERLKGFGIDLEDASGEGHHMLPVPSVFVLDAESRISYVYANPDHKVRCDPEVILSEAKKALD